MISIRNIKTILLIFIATLALTSCKACNDGLDMGGVDDCAENPGSESCQALCNTTGEYQTWCNITEFCARLSDNTECLKRCSEDPTLPWCGENPPPPTVSCPKDGSFKYTTMSGADHEAPVAMRTLEDKLVNHIGGTFNAIAVSDETYALGIGSDLMLAKENKVADFANLKGVIRDLSIYTTASGKVYVIAATDYGPKFIEVVDGKLGEVIAIPQFGETIALGAAKIIAFRHTSEAVPTKTAEGLSISLNAAGGGETNEQTASPDVMDYAVFATKYNGVWGIDLSALKGGCAEYIGETPNNLADIELAGVGAGVNAGAILTMTGVGQAAKIEEYNLLKMASGAKRSKTNNDIRAITIVENKLYGLFGEAKTVNEVAYSAFDTQNWKVTKDFKDSIKDDSLKYATHMALGKMTVITAPLSPLCGGLVGLSDGQIICQEPFPGLVEIDSANDEYTMGLSPLDRSYTIIKNANLNLKTATNFSVAFENNNRKSISSHIDHIKDDVFVSASALQMTSSSADQYSVSISPRKGDELLGWNPLDLNSTFFKDPSDGAQNYGLRSLADLKVSEDKKLVMYLLYALSPDGNKLFVSPYASEINDDYSITELTTTTPTIIELAPSGKTPKFISPIIDEKSGMGDCATSHYGLVLIGKQIFMVSNMVACDGTSSYGMLTLADKFGGNIADAAFLDYYYYILTEDGHVKIFNNLDLKQDLTTPPNKPTKIIVSASTAILPGTCGAQERLYFMFKKNGTWTMDGGPYLRTFDDAYISGNLLYAVSRDNGIEVYDLSK